MSTLSLTIKVLGGSATNIILNDLNYNMKILELKRKLAEKTNIPISRQRLIYKGKVMRNNSNLSSHNGLQSGHTLHLVTGNSNSSNNNNQNNQNISNNNNNNNNNGFTEVTEGVRVGAVGVTDVEAPLDVQIEQIIKSMNLNPSQVDMNSLREQVARQREEQIAKLRQRREREKQRKMLEEKKRKERAEKRKKEGERNNNNNNNNNNYVSTSAPNTSTNSTLRQTTTTTTTTSSSSSNNLPTPPTTTQTQTQTQIPIQPPLQQQQQQQQRIVASNLIPFVNQNLNGLRGRIINSTEATSNLMRDNPIDLDRNDSIRQLSDTNLLLINTLERLVPQLYQMRESLRLEQYIEGNERAQAQRLASDIGSHLSTLGPLLVNIGNTYQSLNLGIEPGEAGFLHNPNRAPILSRIGPIMTRRSNQNEEQKQNDNNNNIPNNIPNNIYNNIPHNNPNNLNQPQVQTLENGITLISQAIGGDPNSINNIGATIGNLINNIATNFANPNMNTGTSTSTSTTTTNNNNNNEEKKDFDDQEDID